MSRSPAAEPRPSDDGPPDDGPDHGSSQDEASGHAGARVVAGAGATITPYRDGPLIVRGTFRLVDQDGAEIDPGRSTIALCRCGKSGIKPFCDGTHKRTGFAAPSAPSRSRPAARIRRDGPPSVG